LAAGGVIPIGRALGLRLKTVVVGAMLAIDRLVWYGLYFYTMCMEFGTRDLRGRHGRKAMLNSW